MGDGTVERGLRERIERMVARDPHEFDLELKGGFPEVGVDLATATELLKERGYRFQFAQSWGPGSIRARFARHRWSGVTTPDQWPTGSESD